MHSSPAGKINQQAKRGTGRHRREAPCMKPRAELQQQQPKRNKHLTPSRHLPAPAMAVAVAVAVVSAVVAVVAMVAVVAVVAPVPVVAVVAVVVVVV